MASQANGSDAGMLLALLSGDRSKRLKQTMAKQLVDVETVSAGMNDANGENTIIKGRNAKAFSILKDELAVIQSGLPFSMVPDICQTWPRG